MADSKFSKPVEDTHSMECAESSKELPSPKPTDDSTEDPADAHYAPRTLGFWMILISLYLSFFLVALDRMIIATAIPAITNEFNSINDIGWYGSAYMFTCAVSNPLFGKLYQLYSTKWTFIASIIVFEAGSALCGAAPSSVALIIGRAIAGFGAAGIGTGAIMVTIPLVPLRKRPVFVSFFGMAFGISSVIGPLIGGTFTDSKLTWRWCFYINLPVGAFALIAILLFLRLPSTQKKTMSIPEQIKQLDPLGMLFFTPSIVSLLLALQLGGSTEPWSSPKVIGLLVTFAVTFNLFIIVEWKLPETAMAPRRVVLNRSVAGAMAFMFFMSGGMMSCVYYISIWFQAVQGQTAMESGIRTIPLVLSLVLFGTLSAIFTQKIGYYVPAMLTAPVLASIAAGLLSTLQPTSGKAMWIGYQIFYGIGLGFGMQTANLASQTVLPRSDVALGTAMNFFSQQLGGSVFLAVSQNIFAHDLLGQLTGRTGLDPQSIVNTGATELRKIVSPQDIGIVIDAYNHGLTRVFILAAGLSAAMLLGAVFVEWRSIKKGQGPKAREAKADAEQAK